MIVEIQRTEKMAFKMNNNLSVPSDSLRLFFRIILSDYSFGLFFRIILSDFLGLKHLSFPDGFRRPNSRLSQHSKLLSPL